MTAAIAGVSRHCSAIALHAGPAADQALEKLVAPGQPESLRERATFWLGSARGHRGYEVLRRIVSEDASDRVREKAVFGLSVSREPEALPTMIEVAKRRPQQPCSRPGAVLAGPESRA